MIMKFHTYIVTLVILLIPMISMAEDSFPAFPMAFWGNVNINDASASVGTIVKAYYGSTFAGQVEVHENGIYGYTKSTKQKLLVSEGAGQITFKFQTSAFNNGAETGGTVVVTHPSFVSGETINKDLAFIFSVPAASPPPSSGGGGGGGGSGGGGGGGGGIAESPTPTPTTAKAGDVTGDGNIDILDFNLLMINWGSNPQKKAADLNGDGKVDIFDFNTLMVNWSK